MRGTFYPMHVECIDLNTFPLDTETYIEPRAKETNHFPPNYS